MAMVTYPLNNVQYNAEDAELYNAVRISGVWSGSAFDAEVTGNNTIVTIGEGLAWIANAKFSGKVVASKEPTELNLGTADPSYNRIDVIAIQFNFVENKTDIVVKKGAATSSPEMPERSTTESLYELYLYSILRPAGSSVVSKSNITDLRDNRDYCGYMQDTVKPGYAPSLMEHNKGDDFRFWVGTKAEYEAQKAILPTNTFCIFTDDKTEEGLWAEINGKAPSGFGLGGACQYVSDWNLAVETGFYQAHINSPTGGSCYGYVLKHTDTYLVQHAFWVDTDNGGAYHAIRSKGVNGFNEWEYENPQMSIGVEYRTTERYMNKSVYTILLSLKNAVNNSVLAPSNFTSIIRHHGRLGGNPLPLGDFAQGTQYAHSYFSASGSNKIVLCITDGFASKQTWYEQIWYTKD